MGEVGRGGDEQCPDFKESGEYGSQLGQGRPVTGGSMPGVGGGSRVVEEMEAGAGNSWLWGRGNKGNDMGRGKGITWKGTDVDVGQKDGKLGTMTIVTCGRGAERDGEEDMKGGGDDGSNARWGIPNGKGK